MSTNFPGSADSYSTHNPGDTISGSHVNNLQDAVAAIEKVALGPQVYNVKGYGAVGDGSTDDATAINLAISAANTAGGGIVYFPSATYIVGSSLTLYSKVFLVGAGIEGTIIKLKNSSNVDVIRTNSFATLTGGNTTGGIYNFGIADLTIDGNVSNQSSACNGISIYGYGYIIKNVRVRNCYTDGIYSEWSTSSSSPGQDAMEAQYSNVKVHDCTNRGINFHGPHDSQFTNIITYSCHRPFHIEPGGIAAGCQVTNLHSWLVTTGGDWSVVLGNGFGSVTNMLAEGGLTGQVLILDGNIVGHGWNIFAAVTLPDTCYGIQIGDVTHSVAGLQIAASIYECQGGAVRFTNETGACILEFNVYLTTGTYVGSTPSSTTKMRMMQCGVNGGNFIESGGIGQSWTLTSTSFSNCFNFNLSSNRLELVNGSNLRGYSGNFSSQTYNVDCSTGHTAGGSYSSASQGSATVLTSSSTITPALGTSNYRMNPSGAVTGIILATASTDGFEICIYNESANLITFAASGTSHVADGTSATIPANTMKIFRWNNAKSLWYHN